MTEQQVAASGMSEVGRITGIFWEPKPVFQDLAAKPRFWVPLILMTLLTVIFMVSYSRVVGWDSMIRRQLESNSRVQQLPAEQRERLIQQNTAFAAPFAYAGAVVAVTVGSLAIAGVLLGMMNLLGGAKLKYKQAFSITVYSSLPSALAAILSMVVMFSKNPEDFDLRSPLPLNLGAFLSGPETGAAVKSLATSINLFTIWIILLMALGFSTAAGKKLSYGKALTLILVPWVVWVLIQAGLAGLTG